MCGFVCDVTSEWALCSLPELHRSRNTAGMTSTDARFMDSVNQGTGAEWGEETERVCERRGEGDNLEVHYMAKSMWTHYSNWLIQGFYMVQGHVLFVRQQRAA